MNDLNNFTEEQIFARTLDGEAGNQGVEGQQAVANVIMQRVALKWQGETTARGVCLHYEQFSCWNGDNLTNGDRARITSPTEESTGVYAQCLHIARLALSGSLADVTNGADSYEVTGSGAYWAKNRVPVIIINKHSFYITRN